MTRTPNLNCQTKKQNTQKKNGVQQYCFCVLRLVNSILGQIAYFYIASSSSMFHNAHRIYSIQNAQLKKKSKKKRNLNLAISNNVVFRFCFVFMLSTFHNINHKLLHMTAVKKNIRYINLITETTIINLQNNKTEKLLQKHF